MDGALLKVFFHRTREWARAKRGLELTKMVAGVLQDLKVADSGFFVYQRRHVAFGGQYEPPSVFFPWGLFLNDEDTLSVLLKESLGEFSPVRPLVEKWIEFAGIPLARYQKAWIDYPIHKVGIWPLTSREQWIGAIIVARSTESVDGLAEDTAEAVMDACAAQLSVAMDMILATKIAEDASQRDLLTGLYNRRGVENYFEKMIHATKEEGKYLVFGLADLNNLKVINDTLGHPEGDQALRKTAEILLHYSSEKDLIGRFGGDEFIMLYQTDEPDAKARLDHLQVTLRNESGGLSISVGGCVWGTEAQTFNECYDLADRRLYESKKEQKNALLSLEEYEEPHSHEHPH